jgi:hypothetical protein
MRLTTTVIRILPLALKGDFQGDFQGVKAAKLIIQS